MIEGRNDNVTRKRQKGRYRAIYYGDREKKEKALYLTRKYKAALKMKTTTNALA